MKLKIITFWGCLFMSLCWGQNSNLKMDGHNKASLQRGAALFMNYCSGCHALKYLRYNRMAEDLGITRPKLLQKNLIFTQAPVEASIKTALDSEDAQQWFGLVPPDLSLIARQRSLPWLYDYLTGFYQDKSRPFGVNNV